MTAIVDAAEFVRRAAECEPLVVEANRTHDPQSLDQAISCLSAMETDLLPRQNAALSGNLAALRIGRFEARGEIARGDLDNALASLDGLLKRDDVDDSLRIAQLGTLASGLRARYASGGSADDLDAAVVPLREMVRLAPPSPVRGRALGDLAYTLVMRWERFSQETDLREALDRFQQALPFTNDAVDIAVLHKRWGAACVTLLSLRPGDESVLADAVSHFEASLEAYPLDHVGRREALNNLAVILQRRALTYGAQRPAEASADIDRAIAVMRELLTAEGAAPTDKAEHQHNLATALLQRDAAGDLQEAASLVAEARAEPEVRGASRAAFADTEGIIENRLYEQTHLEPHADRSASSFQAAATNAASAEIALRAAQSLGALESGRGRWAAAADAYQQAAAVAERMYRGLASRAAKQSWLMQISGLPQRAAIATARAGNAAAAVIVLERTRTMILAERLGRRDAQLEDLRAAGREDLATRYAHTVAAWEAAPQGSAAESAVESAVDAAIAAIRAVHGFEEFLATQVADILSHLASTRPIVFLVVGSSGGMALIAINGDVAVVPLAAFDSGDTPMWDALAQYAPHYDARHTDQDAWLSALDDLLGWMGAAIVGPVLEHLDDVTECVMIPTGVLALLPWHAAWTERDGKRVYLVDVVAVAYAPSLRAMPGATLTVKRRVTAARR